MPATSLNVTRVSPPSERRALERPNDIIPPPAPAIRRDSITNSRMIRITGPKPSRICTSRPGPSSGAFALMTTSLSCSSLSSWSESANSGTSVENSFEVTESFSPLAG